jgi:hypothetical protein
MGRMSDGAVTKVLQTGSLPMSRQSDNYMQQCHVEDPCPLIYLLWSHS